jgi:hypothetical protein
MGLGPIAGIQPISLPTARKVEPAAPRFDIEAAERSGDEPSGDEPSSPHQQASERERKEKENPEDLFEVTAEDDSDVEVVIQTSEEGHDWFV